MKKYIEELGREVEYEIIPFYVYGNGKYGVVRLKTDNSIQTLIINEGKIASLIHSVGRKPTECVGGRCRQWVVDAVTEWLKDKNIQA